MEGAALLITEVVFVVVLAGCAVPAWEVVAEEIVVVFVKLDVDGDVEGGDNLANAAAASSSLRLAAARRALPIMLNMAKGDAIVVVCREAVYGQTVDNRWVCRCEMIARQRNG